MRKTVLLWLTLVGLFDSLYLWWVYTSPSRPMVCVGTGCDAVRLSPFAYPMGVPMPAPGALMYAVLALLVFAEPLFHGGWARAARLAVAGISGLGFFFSLYLTGIEAFVLHAWCVWCVISALAVTGIFALALLEVFRPLPEPDPDAALATARKHFASVILAVVIGVPSFILLAKSGSAPPLPPIPPEVMERLVRPDSHITGNANAPLTVVEFGDIQCAVCRRAEEVTRAIRRRYGDRVRFVFRQFPLASIHSHAQKAAEASECAAAQGKFWEALERFYQGQDDLSEAALVRYAGELGLNVGEFRQCLESGEMAGRVQRDAADARALGLRFTPTFFVGNQVVQGVIEQGAFENLVEQELARVPATRPTPTMPSSTTTETASSPSSTEPATSLRTTKRESSPPPGKGASSPATTSGLGSLGSFGGSPFVNQLGGSNAGCSEDDAKKEQATLINTREARELFESKPQALFVDVRDAKEYRAGHIPGAINIPVDKIHEREDKLPTSRTIVLYESGRGSGDVCAAGRAAGRTLLSMGFSSEHVKVYHDGLAGWEQAGLPAER